MSDGESPYERALRRLYARYERGTAERWEWEQSLFNASDLQRRPSHSRSRSDLAAAAGSASPWAHVLPPRKPSPNRAAQSKPVPRTATLLQASRKLLKRPPQKTAVHIIGLAALLFVMFGWPIVVITADPTAKVGTACDKALIAILFPMAVLWLFLSSFAVLLLVLVHGFRTPLDGSWSGVVGWCGGLLFASFFLLFFVLQVVFFQQLGQRHTPFDRCGRRGSTVPCCSLVVWSTCLIMIVASYASAILLCTYPGIARARQRRQERHAQLRPRYYARETDLHQWMPGGGDESVVDVDGAGRNGEQPSTLGAWPGAPTV